MESAWTNTTRVLYPAYCTGTQLDGRKNILFFAEHLSSERRSFIFVFRHGEALFVSSAHTAQAWYIHLLRGNGCTISIVTGYPGLLSIERFECSVFGLETNERATACRDILLVGSTRRAKTNRYTRSGEKSRTLLEDYVWVVLKLPAGPSTEKIFSLVSENQSWGTS